MKSFNLEYVYIIFILIILIIAFRREINITINLTKTREIESKKVYNIKKTFIYRNIIVIALISWNVFTNRIYNNIDYNEKLSFIEYIKVSNLSIKVFIFSIITVLIVMSINTILLIFSKIGIYENGIVNEFGEFINWNEITSLILEDSLFGKSKVIIIKTKKHEKENFLNTSYKVIICKSKSVEIMSLIANESGLKLNNKA